jgi:hypothetical protein
MLVVDFGRCGRPRNLKVSIHSGGLHQEVE